MSEDITVTTDTVTVHDSEGGSVTLTDSQWRPMIKSVSRLISRRSGDGE